MGASSVLTEVWGFIFKVFLNNILNYEVFGSEILEV